MRAAHDCDFSEAALAPLSAASTRHRDCRPTSRRPLRWPRERVASGERRCERRAAGAFGQVVRESSASRTPSASCASESETKSSSPRCRMPNVRSKVTRVAMPSANVSADSPTTRVPVRQDRATASAFCGADADDPRLQAERVADGDQPARAASAADRHEHDVDVRQRLEDLERVRADAGNQVRLVGGVDVAQAARRRTSLRTNSRASSKSRPCSMSVAPQARIIAFLAGLFCRGHDQRARHAGASGCKSDRLAVVPGGRRDHAAHAVLGDSRATG